MSYTDIKPWPSIPQAILNLLTADVEWLAANPSWIGARFDGTVGDGEFRVRISNLPGGHSSPLTGQFTIELETFGRDYKAADSAAQDLSVAMLGYPHTVEVDGRTVIFDRVEESMGPAELPWTDETVYRFLATYVIIARRR